VSSTYILNITDCADQLKTFITFLVNSKKWTICS